MGKSWSYFKNSTKDPIKNQKGSALLFGMGLVGLGVITSLGILEFAKTIIASRSDEASEMQARFANEKALTMAGYLISNNLVICTEKGMPDAPARKCRWGGNLHKPKEFSVSDFSLSDPNYAEDGSFETSMMIGSLLNRREVKLRFQLANWFKDEQARNIIGMIPKEAAIVDDDWWIVVIQAETSYSFKRDIIKDLRTVGGIRRPLGAPILDIVSSPVCKFSCKAGQTTSPNPECRSAQMVLPKDQDIDITLSFLNLGPGAIFGASYQRSVQYSPIFYPSKTTPELSRIETLPTTEVALMPLDKIEVVDKFVCATPEFFQSADTATDNRQFMNIFMYSYEISVARFDPKDPSYAAGGSTRSAFLAQYDPLDQTTYIANPTVSHLEPRKAGGTLGPLDSNLAVLPSISPPPPPAPTTQWAGGDGAGGGGDGDGGGGGN